MAKVKLVRRTASSNDASSPKTDRAYPALLLSQNKHRFYFSTIPVDDLFSHCFVSRRDTDPNLGFQRALNSDRADDIAAYLASGSGSIPSNIVLSAQPDAEFEYNRRTKSISFARVQKGFLVLDGQHRLWGYEKCKVRHRVPVAIYEGLTRAAEAKLFIDINTTQRGVPAALLLDIKQVAEVESQRERILRELFDRLAKDSKSPLAGKLSPSKSLAGKISRVTFNRAVGPTLEAGVMMDASADQRYKLVLNYLNAFDAELVDKRLLTRSTFFEAIFEIFDEVVRTSVTTQGNAKQESLQESVRPLARIDFDASGVARYTTGAYVTLLKTALRKSLPISEDML